MPEAAHRTAEERREALVEVYKEASACVKCPLSESRTQVVFGSGNSDADLMFVGEAPGAEEDRQGLPFVGRAGNFLTQLLEGIGLRREDVFIANVLKCRPPGNRDPQPDEIDSCRPWLETQVELIQPKVIGTLGNFATKLLTGNPTGITRVRGAAQEHVLGGRPVLLLPLFHPAAGLRTKQVAEQLREDFELIPELLARPAPEPPVEEPSENIPTVDEALAGLADGNPPTAGTPAAHEPGAMDEEPVVVSDDQLGLFGR